jgi:hypothetical protein
VRDLLRRCGAASDPAERAALLTRVAYELHAAADEIATPAGGEAGELVAALQGQACMAGFMAELERCDSPPDTCAPRQLSAMDPPASTNWTIVSREGRRGIDRQASASHQWFGAAARLTVVAVRPRLAECLHTGPITDDNAQSDRPQRTAARTGCREVSDEGDCGDG